MKENVALKAGNLDLRYQEGFIRYVRLGNLEVIRMINHAVRDHNWGTIPMKIRDEKVEVEPHSFHISYLASFLKGDIDFELNCEISGNEDGTLDFVYDGLAKKDFRKNRIGFTVLHPIQSCQGKKVRIVHPDGKASEGRFPVDISPHQPFFDIKEMHWKLTDGVDVSLVFEGDVFETEDQRNWTDASYKTYCTPLGKPYPVTLKKGDRIQQKAHLRVDAAGTSLKASEEHPIQIYLQGQKLGRPEFGIELKSGTDRALILQALQELSPDFWRISLELDDDIGPALELLKEVQRTETAVELCVFSDRQHPGSDLEELKSYFGSVKRMMLFGDSHKTTPTSWIKAISKLRKSFPKISIIGGTDAFFTELNRDPVDASDLDGVTYSINPQVHAFDDASLIETLEAQAYTVHSAKKLFPAKKIIVSPVTFHMRWNPNATEAGKKLRQPTGWKDPRQFSFFGACWFLISLKYLSESGAHSVTYFELTGDSGWLKSKGSDILKSPIYGLREEIKSFSQVINTTSNQPFLVDSIGFKNADESALLVVNWTDMKQTVSVPKEFAALRVCQKWDTEFGKFDWEEMKGLQNLEFDELMPKSLTWFGG